MLKGYPSLIPWALPNQSDWQSELAITDQHLFHGRFNLELNCSILGNDASELIFKIMYILVNKSLKNLNAMCVFLFVPTRIIPSILWKTDTNWPPRGSLWRQSSSPALTLLTSFEPEEIFLLREARLLTTGSKASHYVIAFLIPKFKSLNPTCFWFPKLRMEYF